MTTTDAFRPTTLDDVVGQTAVVEELRVALEASKVRGDMPGHMLFVGPAGTGKTTLSLIIAHSEGGRLVQLLGPAIRSFGRDVMPALMGLQPRDVVFIDEIHRMSRPAQESLFPVMEDGKLQDGTITFTLPPITFVGATTDPERLLTPMLDRFTRILRLVPYSPDELATIVARAAAKLGCALGADSAALIGARAHGVPRVALRMMLAARDYAYAAVPMGAGYNAAEWQTISGQTQPTMNIGLAAVQQALASSAYEWQMTGRNAMSR